SAGTTTGTTTLTIVPTVNLAVGTTGVLCLALDNAGSGGGTPASPTSITDSVGNVWTRQINPIYDPVGASAGVEVAVYTAQILIALTTSDSIVVTWAGGVS